MMLIMNMLMCTDNNNYLQTKKRSHQTKYIRRCPANTQANRVNGDCLGKRNQQKTPKKVSYAYKSLFKSPFVKRFKKSRTLFSNPCSLMVILVTTHTKSLTIKGFKTTSLNSSI